MSQRLAYAVIVLFVLGAAPGWGGLFWNLHNEHVAQAAQARAGLLVERKLCADVVTMAAIEPPAGNAAVNPSRGYEQAEHQAWAGLVLAIGCKEGP